MTKIDLTPEELREFARLEKLYYSSNKRITDQEIARLGELSTRQGGAVASPLTVVDALADAMEERDRLRHDLKNAEGLHDVVQWYLTPQMPIDTDTLGHDSFFVYSSLRKALADLEAAREAINYATENILDYDDAEWAAWNAMPAVRAALGKDADGND